MYQCPESTNGPVCPCLSSVELPSPARPRPPHQPQGHQPLPQWDSIRATLWLSIALICLAMAPGLTVPATGPRPSLALACPHPQGGAWGCPSATSCLLLDGVMAWDWLPGPALSSTREPPISPVLESPWHPPPPPNKHVQCSAWKAFD